MVFALAACDVAKPDAQETEGKPSSGGLETPFEKPVESKTEPEKETAAPDEPVEEIAYTFGVYQGNVGATYYLAGGMNGYYMETTDNIGDALYVYLEETYGGYHLYCYVDGAKIYINMVVSGTHVNGAYEAKASTTYRLDSRNTLIAIVNGIEYQFGTRRDMSYTTVGPSAVSYNGFYCVLAPVATDKDAPTVTETDAPTITETDVSTETETGTETETEPEAHEHADINGDFKCDVCETVMIPDADSTLTITQAIALGKLFDHNTHTESKYYVEGVISQIYNRTYGNMYIVDADGNKLNVYGTFSEDGSVRFDSLAEKPSVGDTVKIYGIIGAYNGDAQIKNGWIQGNRTTYALGETWVVDGVFEFTVDAVFEHELCNSYANNDDKFCCVLIKVHYKNVGLSSLYFSAYDMNVYDECGAKSTTYPCTHGKDLDGCIMGMQSTGIIAYALENESSKVTLTVQKNIEGKNYTATFSLDVHKHSYADATCQTPKTCTECGWTEGEKGDHNYVDGVCAVCEKRDPNYVAEYEFGETWIVDGMFEFTINSITQHSICNSRYDYSNDIGATTAIMVSYTYKNLGMDKLIFDEWSMDVYDSCGAEGDTIHLGTWCRHDVVPQNCIEGGSYTAAIPVALINYDGALTIFVSKEGCKAKFVINPEGSSTEEEDASNTEYSGGYLNKGIPRVEDVFPGITCFEIKTGVTDAGYNIFYRFNNVSLGAYNEYCEYIESEGARLVTDNSISIIGSYDKEYTMNGQNFYCIYIEGIFAVNFYDLSSLPET